VEVWNEKGAIMGRELKRVPLDFNWPLETIWYGYQVSLCRENCYDCRIFAKTKGIPLLAYDCPDFEILIGPPRGDGYQLWMTTNEGSPISPVFATLDELCEWCEENATIFAYKKADKEEWRQMLEADFVHYQMGNITFI